MLRGGLAFLIGLFCFAYPGVTLMLFVIVFGSYTLIDGLLAIAAAITRAKAQPRWWSTLIEGIAGGMIGVIILTWPGISAVGLLYLMATWAPSQVFSRSWRQSVCGDISSASGSSCPVERLRQSVDCSYSSCPDRAHWPCSIGSARMPSLSDSFCSWWHSVYGDGWPNRSNSHHSKLLDQRTMGDKNLSVRRWMVSNANDYARTPVRRITRYARRVEHKRTMRGM